MYSEYSEYWEYSDKDLFGKGGRIEFSEYFEFSELADSFKKIIMLSEYSEYWEYSDKDLFGKGGNWNYLVKAAVLRGILEYSEYSDNSQQKIARQLPDYSE